MDYRKEIDGLRAVAVVPVILFHAGNKLFPGGFVGVDVFFVISGYLITSIIATEMQAGKFSLIGFYERRARRILPALFVVLLACLPFAMLWMSPLDGYGFYRSVIAVSVFASNILFWRESGYFDVASELKPLLHTWSLAVEEQYYLLFPLALMLTWRLGKRWIAGLLAVAGLLSLAVAQWGALNKPDAAFFLLPTRGWELLIGALVAFYLLKPESAFDEARPASQIVKEIVGSFGLLLIAYSVFAFDEDTQFPGVHALVPTIGAASVILAAGPRTIAGKLLGSRIFVGIGLLSYSAYLWHQPLFAFLRYRGTIAQSPSFQVAVVCLTMLLSFLTWKHVERPFRIRSIFNRRQIFVFAGTGTVCFLIVGTIGVMMRGFYDIKLGPEQKHIMETAIPSPKRDECHANGPNYPRPGNSCTYFGGNVNWVVFGDSHAVELAYSIAQELSDSGSGIRHLSFTGCPPTFGQTDDRSPCALWTKEAVEYIVKARSIENVVVSYRINAHLFGKHESAYPKIPNDVAPELRAARWKSYVGVLEEFLKSGKKVYLVFQAPELSNPIGNLIYRHPSERTIIGVPRVWWNERNTYLRSNLADIPKGVVVIDPTEIFCDGGSCYAVKDGVALYHDDDHVSVAGAQVLAKQVVRAASVVSH